MEIEFGTFGVSSFCGRPETMDDAHSHTEIELNRLEAGRVVYQFAGEQIEFVPGKLYVFSGLRPHRMIESSLDARMCWITFPAWHVGMWDLPEDFTLQLTSGAVVVDSDTYEFERDAERFNRWRRDISTRELRSIRLFLLEIRARMERLSLSPLRSLAQPFLKKRTNHLGKAGMAVVQMQGYILRNMSAHLEIRDVARDVDLNPNYASTIFKQHTGMTINEFIMRQRLDYAKLLLVSSNRKILDVALEAGFGSLSRFYEAFSRSSPLTPSEFRKMSAASGAALA